MSIVLDDSRSAWLKDAVNLVGVDRYFFFPGGQGEPFRLGSKRDESASEGALMQASDLLERLHAQVYAAFRQTAGGALANSPALGLRQGVFDVRPVLKQERAKVP